MKNLAENNNIILENSEEIKEEENTLLGKLSSISKKLKFTIAGIISLTGIACSDLPDTKISNSYNDTSSIKVNNKSGEDFYLKYVSKLPPSLQAAIITEDFVKEKIRDKGFKVYSNYEHIFPREIKENIKKSEYFAKELIDIHGSDYFINNYGYIFEQKIVKNLTEYIYSEKYLNELIVKKEYYKITEYIDKFSKDSKEKLLTEEVIRDILKKDFWHGMKIIRHSSEDVRNKILTLEFAKSIDINYLLNCVEYSNLFSEKVKEEIKNNIFTVDAAKKLIETEGLEEFFIEREHFSQEEIEAVLTMEFAQELIAKEGNKNFFYFGNRFPLYIQKEIITKEYISDLVLDRENEDFQNVINIFSYLNNYQDEIKQDLYSDDLLKKIINRYGLDSIFKIGEGYRTIIEYFPEKIKYQVLTTDLLKYIVNNKSWGKAKRYSDYFSEEVKNQVFTKKLAEQKIKELGLKNALILEKQYGDIYWSYPTFSYEVIQSVLPNDVIIFKESISESNYYLYRGKEAEEQYNEYLDYYENEPGEIIVKIAFAGKNFMDKMGEKRVNDMKSLWK